MEKEFKDFLKSKGCYIEFINELAWVDKVEHEFYERINYLQSYVNPSDAYQHHPWAEIINIAFAWAKTEDRNKWSVLNSEWREKYIKLKREQRDERKFSQYGNVSESGSNIGIHTVSPTDGGWVVGEWTTIEVDEDGD